MPRRPINHNWYFDDGRQKAEIYAEVDQDESGAIIKIRRIVIVAGAQVDCDGRPDSPHVDRDGLSSTSLSKDSDPAWKGKGQFVDSFEIPFFVLPLNWADVLGDSSNLGSLYQDRLGEMARISYGADHVYAIYADKGGRDTRKIGEASYKTARELLQTTNCRNGINKGVRYEIIPGSERLEITTDHDTIQSYGLELFGPVRT